MHNTELMMAIIIASTSLIGLIGVTMPQMGERAVSPWLQIIRIAFVFSFLMGLSATASAIGWFAEESYGKAVQTVIFFTIQMVLVSGASAYYWVRRYLTREEKPKKGKA